MARDVRMVDIMFKDPNNSFSAGGSVDGHVCLDVSQQLKVKSIKLQLQGISKVNWDEKKSLTKGSAPSASHKTVAICFDATVPIKGSPDTLAAGRYDWPFSESIPAFCPATFKGQWGWVQYVGKLVIQRGIGKADIELTKHFTVRGVLDLNHEDDAKLELVNSGDLRPGIMCCKSRPITGRIQLQKKGYVSPEAIPFVVDVQNNSKRKCRVKVILTQEALFKADYVSKRSSQPLKGISYKSALAAGEVIHWEGQISAIPPLPPSHLGGGCKNIDLTYIVMLVVSPSGPGNELEVPLEITLGTVPLRKLESSGPMLTVKAAASRSDYMRNSPRTKRAAFAGGAKVQAE